MSSCFFLLRDPQLHTYQKNSQRRKYTIPLFHKEINTYFSSQDNLLPLSPFRTTTRSAKTRQMQTLIITTSPTQRNLTPSLKINLPIIPSSQHPTNQEIQLSPPSTRPASNNRVSFQPPSRRRRRGGKRQGLVGRTVGSDDAQVRAAVAAPDRSGRRVYVEVLAALFGAHYWDCFFFKGEGEERG